MKAFPLWSESPPVPRLARSVKVPRSEVEQFRFELAVVRAEFGNLRRRIDARPSYPGYGLGLWIVAAVLAASLLRHLLGVL